jgi:hypothetical protein
VNVEDRPEPLLGSPQSSGEAESSLPSTAESAPGLPEIALQTRRAIVPAVALGVIGLVVGFVIGQPLGGIGVCIGLAVGMANARLLQDSVQRRFELLAAAPGKRTNFLSSGATRLAALTLGTLLLVWLVRPLGFGVLIGLAVFQVTMIGFAAAAMYKAVRS